MNRAEESSQAHDEAVLVRRALDRGAGIEVGEHPAEAGGVALVGRVLAVDWKRRFGVLIEARRAPLHRAQRSGPIEPRIRSGILAVTLAVGTTRPIRVPLLVRASPVQPAEHG